MSENVETKPLRTCPRCGHVEPFCHCEPTTEEEPAHFTCFCPKCQSAITDDRPMARLHMAGGILKAMADLPHLKPLTPRLPESVKIGPFVYKIEVNGVPDGDHNWGECDNINRVLRLGELAKFRPRQLAITFFHELIHGVEACWEIDLTEEQVTRLTNGLTDVLQQLGFYPQELNS